MFGSLQFKCGFSLLGDNAQNFVVSELFLAGPFWATQNSSFSIPYLSAIYIGHDSGDIILMGHVFWSFVGCCEMVVELKQSIVAFFPSNPLFSFMPSPLLFFLLL